MTLLYTNNQLNIMVPYVDIICLCHSVAILLYIYVMRQKWHVKWVRFHFKRMLITGLGQYTLHYTPFFITKKDAGKPKYYENQYII